MRPKSLLALALLLAPVAEAQVSSPAIDARFSRVYTTQNTANPVAAETTDLTAVADTAGSLAGTYFTFSDALDAHKYLAWYKVSGTGTAPVVAGRTAIEIDILTGDTNSTVAGASRTALAASAAATYITVSGATTHIILTNKSNGASTDVADGTVPTTFTISKTLNGVSGTLATSTAQSADQGWRICNNGVNTSTWLAVGPTAGDPTTTGQRLAPGKCYQCLSCPSGLLKALYVSSQAASNGYSITEFKQ